MWKEIATKGQQLGVIQNNEINNTAMFTKSFYIRKFQSFRKRQTQKEEQERERARTIKRDRRIKVMTKVMLAVGMKKKKKKNHLQLTLPFFFFFYSYRHWPTLRMVCGLILNHDDDTERFAIEWYNKTQNNQEIFFKFVLRSNQ
jgi:hypothetical protein